MEKWAWSLEWKTDIIWKDISLRMNMREEEKRRDRRVYAKPDMYVANLEDYMEKKKKHENEERGRRLTGGHVYGRKRRQPMCGERICETAN